ncbi:MAG: hypothetical protein II338_05590, partial [Bacteroidaceae bacterium]|nr:hypothetical protein [Bacteroidaceae bacterium]
MNTFDFMYKSLVCFSKFGKSKFFFANSQTGVAVCQKRVSELMFYACRMRVEIRVRHVAKSAVLADFSASTAENSASTADFRPCACREYAMRADIRKWDVRPRVYYIYVCLFGFGS